MASFSALWLLTQQNNVFDRKKCFVASFVFVVSLDFLYHLCVNTNRNERFAFYVLYLWLVLGTSTLYYYHLVLTFIWNYCGNIIIQSFDDSIKNISLFNIQYCSERLKEYTLLLKTSCDLSITNLIISTAKIIDCS